MPDRQNTRQVPSLFEDAGTAITQFAAAAIRSVPLYTPDFESGVYRDEAFLRPLKRLMSMDKTLTLPNPNCSNANAMLTSWKNKPGNTRV